MDELPKSTLATLGIAALFVVAALHLHADEFMQTIDSIQEQATAGIYGIASITVADLRSTYDRATPKSSRAVSHPLAILIVPGHEPFEGGTEYKGVYERDIVVDIADKLASYLEQNPRYHVIVARSKTAWEPTLETYFNENASDIEAFRASQITDTNTHIASGDLAFDANAVEHNVAPGPVALHLYGINKWAGENDVAITLHLHINDYRGRRGANTYTGFTIYVPDRHFSNASASRSLAEALLPRLAAYHAKSTLPNESAGIVEDQELIAVGSNNSADSASLLIEYGYIYEPQFMNSTLESAAADEYAYATYLGLQDFFHDTPASENDAPLLSYAWDTVTAIPGEKGIGAYALQTALHHLGFYPVNGRSLSDCPITGTVGPCTQAALTAYQQARGLPATGTLGPQTRASLTSDILRAHESGQSEDTQSV